MGCAQKDDSASRRFQIPIYSFVICKDESLGTASWVRHGKMQNCERGYVFDPLVLPPDPLGYDRQK
jgi:hypothetical protein